MVSTREIILRKLQYKCSNNYILEHNEKNLNSYDRTVEVKTWMTIDLYRFEVKYISSSSSSSERSAQGQIFHCKLRNQGYSSAEGRSSTTNSGTRLHFYQEWIGTVASRCFPHPNLSLAYEQTLKDLKRSQGHHVDVRILDLANWALWTSPKFATWVKYHMLG